MKKHEKSGNKQFLHKRAGLALIILLLTSVLVFYSYNLYSIEKDRRLFVGLREDMKSLQEEFNKVQGGWEYDEGCKGGGGVYDSDIPSLCFINISNNSNGVTPEAKENSEKYQRTIKDSNLFVNISNPSTYDTYNEVIMQYRISPNIKCVFQYSNSSDLTTPKDSPLTLSCLGDSKGFHFVRIDK